MLERTDLLRVIRPPIEKHLPFLELSCLSGLSPLDPINFSLVIPNTKANLDTLWEVVQLYIQLHQPKTKYGRPPSEFQLAHIFYS